MQVSTQQKVLLEIPKVASIFQAIKLVGTGCSLSETVAAGGLDKSLRSSSRQRGETFCQHPAPTPSGTGTLSHVGCKGEACTWTGRKESIGLIYDSRYDRDTTLSNTLSTEFQAWVKRLPCFTSIDFTPPFCTPTRVPRFFRSYPRFKYLSRERITIFQNWFIITFKLKFSTEFMREISLIYIFQFRWRFVEILLQQQYWHARNNESIVPHVRIPSSRGYFRSKNFLHFVTYASERGIV